MFTVYTSPKLTWLRRSVPLCTERVLHALWKRQKWLSSLWCSCYFVAVAGVGRLSILYVCVCVHVCQHSKSKTTGYIIVKVSCLKLLYPYFSYNEIMKHWINLAQTVWTTVVIWSQKTYSEKLKILSTQSIIYYPLFFFLLSSRPSSRWRWGWR